MADDGNPLDVLDVVKNLDAVPKLFYEKILSHCRSTPSRLDQAKQLFVTALDKQIEDLLSKKSYTEIFDCFQDAQNLYPDDADVLNALGVALNRLGKPLEALNYFNKAHQLCPEKLKIAENRTNVINEWIPRWHFIMLNDTKRNEAFRRAIFGQIQQKQMETVLDIGTGTGLLALYAHQAGAKRIFACESNEVMVSIATNVLHDNDATNVTLLRDHSTNLTSKDLQDSRVDLIVTEIFDSGIFGEGVLSTLIHAKENLLKDGGEIVPNKVKVYVVGVDRLGIAEKQESIESTLENSIYLKNTILISKTGEPYDTYSPSGEGDHLVIRTDPVHAFTVDFNDTASMERAEKGELDAKIQLSCTEEGHIEAFLVYFALYLDDDTNIIRNLNPTCSNGITTKCWEPVIFPLGQPIEIRKYQILKATMSCKGGVLNLTHEYNPIDKRVLAVDAELYSFLTDDEYLYELEYNVNKFLKKNKKQCVNFADFLIFPHIGINLLKEGKIQNLYCSEKIKDFIEEIANLNCISKEAIKFINDLDDLFHLDAKFDLILLQPITGDGTLNEDHLKHYEKLRTHCLSSNGTIFPSKIDLCAKLVHSSWVQQVTRVKNADLEAASIQKYMNAYSTHHQYEFKNFESCDLSEVFTISKIHFDEGHHERDVTVNLNMVRSQINGILYYYKIFFTNNSIPISTNRRKSFYTQNCFVQDFDVAESKTNVVVRFMQDELVFRCWIVDSNS